MEYGKAKGKQRERKRERALVNCGGPHMQRDCPGATWKNSGFQVRSLDDPGVKGQFGCLRTIEDPTDTPPMVDGDKNANR